MMELTVLMVLVALGSVVFTITNAVRYAFATDWSSLLTQGIAWVSGVLAVFIVSYTQIGALVAIGTLALSDLHWWDKVLVGIAAASSISVVYQFKQALDTTDTAAVTSFRDLKEFRAAKKAKAEKAKAAA